MMKGALDQAHIAGLRWTILRTLGIAGHLGATDKMCVDVARAEYLGITEWRIRTELDYLESRGLIEIERSEVRSWRAKLTRHGRDMVDYEIDVEPGITRPPRLDPHGD